MSLLKVAYFSSLEGASSVDVNRFYRIKNYDYWTEDLISEIDYTHPYVRNDLNNARQMAYTNMQQESVETDNVWNFMGNPLSKSVIETIIDPYGNVTANNPVTTSYAYWDSTKYFQQKAVKDPMGRFSFTDYFTNTAPAGSRGQKQYVYDPKNCTYTGTGGSGDAWKSTISPTTPGSNYCGAFQYDAQGRCTNVWKLQSTTTSPWTYVQTQNTYGADGSPTWGQAWQVVEDYGGINRTTVNNAYTAWGKPCQVTDAAGHVFTTTLDNDGNIISVTTPTQILASYSYGPSGISYGVPISISDGLTGVTQNLTYQGSGGGIGNIAEVDQIGGLNPNYNTSQNGKAGYSVNYAYDSIGDRINATYSTANGVISWQYGDYEEVGTADNPKRVFQTLTKLSGGTGSNLTAEEMDYQYDSMGRLAGAAFAQTPYTGFTPSTGNPWYDSGHPAQSRARAYYAYDATGRTLSCEHYWDSLPSGSNTYGTSQTLLANECVYDPVLGLKTTSSFYDQTSGAPTTWNQTRQESYGYDPQLDYLTAANYGDGLANQTPAWSYDAAGNRADFICDNLNRTIVNGATNCDILGNRLSLGSSTTYSWDCMNRMVGLTNSAATSSYEYRADGMRTHKSVGSVNTEYYHDGQKPIEDSVINGTTLTATRYGLGVRGIDYEEAATGSWTNNSQRSLGAFSNVGFPIYDAHGNMVATLARSGANGYQANNQRSYDAWGQVRQGTSSGDPKGRYCANLGHQQDDESALVYMRARYYEPGSGRFISEDSDHKDRNWFSYCSNGPTLLVDKSGNNPLLLAAISMLWSDYARIMTMIVSASALSKPDAIRQLLSAQSEIGGFDLMISQLQVNYFKDGLTAMGSGNTRQAEFCEDMGEAIGIVGRAMIASLEESLNIEFLIVMMNGGGIGSG